MKKMALSGVYKIFNERWCNQTVWIISDTHFGDEDLRAGMPGRPSDAEIVKMINSKVGRKDTLICLGDVGDIEFAKQLRAAHKVLIMGNHDAGHTNYERQIITQQFFKKHYTKQQVMDLVKSMFPNCKYTIDESNELVWEITADNLLFDEVYEGALIVGEKLILSHEPLDTPWAFNIHGHTHKKTKSDGRHLNVCCDVVGYTPLNMNQLMKSGIASKIESIHRETIDKATIRKKKRGGKKIGSK